MGEKAKSVSGVVMRSANSASVLAVTTPFTSGQIRFEPGLSSFLNSEKRTGRMVA